MQRVEEERGVKRMQAGKEGRRKEDAGSEGRKKEGGCMQSMHAEGAGRGHRARGEMERRHGEDAGSMHEGIYMNDHDGRHRGGGQGRKDEERGGGTKP